MPATTLLVVEDEPILALELKETLERMGFTVPKVIASADEALQAYNEVRPDLVIMDIQLRSYNNGIDAIKRIRMLHQVPVIFLTANQNFDVEIQARTIDKSVYITKPYDEQELKETIEELL